MSELLANDPRTAWAWAEHLETENPRQVSDELAQQLIEAIQDGDHVEVFAEGKILRGKRARVDDSDRGKKGHLIARTLRRWILVRNGNESADVLDAPAKGSMTSASAFENKRHIWCTHYKDAKVKLFVDDYESEVVDRICGGAGYAILSLPSWGDVPEPPRVSDLGDDAPIENDSGSIGLTTDWRAAELFALQHMKNLGFHGARLTGGGRDKGVDIVHEEAVAQVKMQGVPVGAPVVQQLRGARPELRHHLFFSTSGYTASAAAEASESGVGLFRIDAIGQVTPVGGIARKLEMESVKRRSGPEGPVAVYMDRVSGRVHSTFTDYESAKLSRSVRKNEPLKGEPDRAFGYLTAARNRLRAAPQIGSVPLVSVVNHYRHADLLAAVFRRELGV